MRISFARARHRFFHPVRVCFSTSRRSPRVLDAVFEPFDSRFLGAARAAVEGPVALDAVADDLAAAMGALRRQRVDGALERVEGVWFPSHRHGERLVIVVAAYLAFRHWSPGLS